MGLTRNRERRILGRGLPDLMFFLSDNSRSLGNPGAVRRRTAILNTWQDIHNRDRTKRRSFDGIRMD